MVELVRQVFKNFFLDFEVDSISGPYVAPGLVDVVGEDDDTSDRD